MKNKKSIKESEQNDKLLVPKVTRLTTNENKKAYKEYAGFFFAILASLLNVASTLLIKKTIFFNQFDISLIRYIVQFIILLIIAISSKVNIFGEKRSLKLLILRGVISGFGLIALNASIKMIDPSDAISLFSTNIIFVAILSRIFMKEKLAIIHFISLVLFITGIIFITQPSFLIPKTKSTEIFTSNITSNSTTNMDSIGKYLITTIGICAGLFAGFIYGSASVIIKQLASQKQHFTVINLFACYFGLPLCLICVLISLQFGPENRDFNQIYEIEFLWEVGYAIFSAITGVFSQVFWIISLKYEDGTKIAMYRTADLLFTFLFQFIFLGISSNMYSIIGSICIATGMFIVMGFKFLDKREQTKKEKKNFLKIVEMKNLNDSQSNVKLSKNESTNCCRKILFHKF